MAEGNNLLATYFEVPIERMSGSIGNWRNDGAVRVICGSNCANRVGAAHLEYKNELCGSQTSPEQQMLGSHLKLLIETPFVMARSVCPALLFTIAGPHMGVSATVHARGPCVDPVVPLLPLLVLKQDKEMMTQVARALKAAKVCVAGLQAHYESLDDAQPTDVEMDQLMYPYPRHFYSNGVLVPFVYDQQIEDKLVFRAHINDAMADFAVGQEIVVKFTKSYSVDAHQLCYAVNQSAPRLYAHQQLANGWLMLVMEAVKGEYFQDGLPTHVKDKLWQAVSHLHDQGLVHGDLRANNICVMEDRVCIIDFDWSGRTNEQRYPDFMNHLNIEWPDGARDGEVLLPTHDLEWLKRVGVEK